MTSEEIREVPLFVPGIQGISSIDVGTNMLLREIAAQLAQLNEGLASITHPGGPQINTKQWIAFEEKRK